MRRKEDRQRRKRDWFSVNSYNSLYGSIRILRMQKSYFLPSPVLHRVHLVNPSPYVRIRNMFHYLHLTNQSFLTAMKKNADNTNTALIGHCL